LRSFPSPSTRPSSICCWYSDRDSAIVQCTIAVRVRAFRTLIWRDFVAAAVKQSH